MIDQPPTSPSQPEMLIAAALHLMSNYSTRNALDEDQPVCVKLAAVIERHLAILSELPELSPVLRATCGQLAEQWTTVVERSLPRPTQTGRANLISRWRN